MPRKSLDAPESLPKQVRCQAQWKQRIQRPRSMMKYIRILLEERSQEALEGWHDVRTVDDSSSVRAGRHGAEEDLGATVRRSGASGVRSGFFVLCGYRGSPRGWAGRGSVQRRGRRGV